MEKEDQDLEEIIRQLRSEIAEAKAKLEKHEALEERFEEGETRFKAIFNQSMLGNKVIDPDLRIMQVNAALLEMLGYTEEELVGRRIIEFSHPDFIHHWQKLQKSLWEEKTPAFKIETRLRKKDGSYLWCQATSTLFQDQGVSLGYTSLEDISGRRALEAQLKKQYDNQETIMHMVAHDLKNPLYNIKLAAELLKGSLEELLAREKEGEDETVTYVNLISQTTKQALAIIDDLLLIGEVEAVNFTQEEINLGPFIQASLNTLSPSLQSKNIRVRIHSPAEPVYGLADPEKFRRVLENIVSNAIKFSRPEGLVTITLEKEGGKARLQIRDNGIGIPARLQATIFDKFTEARRPGTRGERTTGLGLFIVKQIVEKQGGKIWVESQEDVGTTFFIQLDSD